MLLIATPHDSVPTKDAYAGVPKSGPDRWEGYKLAWETASDAERSFGGPLLDSGAFFNAFEVSVFPKHPLVGAMKDKFLDLGARVALMSGSGASVFGIFADRTTAETAAKTLKAYSRYIALTKFWHT